MNLCYKAIPCINVDKKNELGILHNTSLFSKSFQINFSHYLPIAAITAWFSPLRRMLRSMNWLAKAIKDAESRLLIFIARFKHIHESIIFSRCRHLGALCGVTNIIKWQTTMREIPCYFSFIKSMYVKM